MQKAWQGKDHLLPLSLSIDTGTGQVPQPDYWQHLLCKQRYKPQVYRLYGLPPCVSLGYENSIADVFAHTFSTEHVHRITSYPADDVCRNAGDTGNVSTAFHREGQGYRVLKIERQQTRMQCLATKGTLIHETWQPAYFPST